jgi:NAD(P)-dependent dehydrogenase (short-subunit alcohol dehydrogenase family)
LAERAALITGGSSGIGLAIARALGEDGYGVTIAARRPEKLEAAAEELRGAGLDVHSIAANMTDEDAVAGLVSSHKERFGRLDVMVNNAGVGIGEAMHELTTKYVDMQLGVNLRAVIIGTREALPLLREAGAEHRKALIVNTASIAGKSGQPWLSVYSATKAAVIGFS